MRVQACDSQVCRRLGMVCGKDGPQWWFLVAFNHDATGSCAANRLGNGVADGWKAAAPGARLGITMDEKPLRLMFFEMILAVFRWLSVLCWSVARVDN